MLKRISYFVITALMFGISLAGFTHTRVYAQINPKGQACEALDAASGTPGACVTQQSGQEINGTIRLAINIFSLIVGIAAIIMIIVGGLKYIISNGESSNINSAKNTILYAIIGLVVVALAQIIVKFVLTKSTASQCAPPTTLQVDGTCA